MHTITFKLDDEFYQILNSMVKSVNTTKSELIRQSFLYYQRVVKYRTQRERKIWILEEILLLYSSKIELAKNEILFELKKHLSSSMLPEQIVYKKQCLSNRCMASRWTKRYSDGSL